MKLREDFLTQNIDDTQFLVPVGAEAFHGVVRSNRTASMIVDCLKKETTQEAIVDALCERFDAPRETVSEDVGRILATLRQINALEE